MLSGTVRNTRDEPSPDAAIVIFADDPDRWAPPSRFVRTVGSNRDGAFRTSGLPPGAYLVFAVDQIESTSPSMLEWIRRSGLATPVTLGEGQPLAVDLRLIEGF